MAVKIIYFVHGSTQDNIEHKASGWNNIGLSEKGVAQSKDLMKQINYDEIDFVITSDLKRARQTANNVFLGQKIIMVDKRLRECNYGEYNGKDSKLVKYLEHIYIPFPNGESLLDVKSRVEDFCDYVLNNFNGKTIAVVSHRAPQLILEHLTKNISIEEAIASDWRNNKAWEPGWKYIIEKKPDKKMTLDDIEFLK